MNISLLLTLSFLVTAECAGGYQNCLERVWIFQSFLIDQQNPEADRKIGYQCSKWKENACEGNWVACRGRQGRPQRNFDDFQVFLGNRSPSISMTQAAYRLDGSLDSKQMATNCIWAWGDRGKPPFNFKGHKTVRDGSTGFNDLINRIGQINNDNYNKPAVRAAAGDGLFQNIDDTLTKITASRVADHSRHLIPAAVATCPASLLSRKTWGPALSTAQTMCRRLAPNQMHRSGGRSTGRPPLRTPLTQLAPAPKSAAGWIHTIAGLSLTNRLESTGRCSGRTKPSKTEQTVAGSTNQPTATFLDIKGWDSPRYGEDAKEVESTLSASPHNVHILVAAPKESQFSEALAGCFVST
ncbi:hypothetical protein ACEPPN_012099 [Leptodophora sp. 'Broadleaf-Isolate-01']